jgi:hypothetical protein
MSRTARSAHQLGQRLLIARPRPVPPYLRVVEAVGLAERLEQAAHASSGHADAGVAHGEVQLVRAGSGRAAR